MSGATETQAPSPHRNLGLTTGLQWALLALAATLAWSFWPTSQPDSLPRVAPRPNWDGFLAVAYAGVSSRSDGRRVATSRFREHLRSMAAAGYHPITLEEAIEFMTRRAPLPEKAVLLTLDDGRRETVEEAEKVLSKLGVPVTLFVRPDPMERGNYYYPTWRELRSLYLTGRWSYGFRGSEPGEAWKLLRRRLHPSTPIAMALPRQDGSAAGDDAVEVPDERLRSFFPLAFAETGYAFNHWQRNPARLTRLAIEENWSGDELVRWLDAQRPRWRTARETSGRDWIRPYGRVRAGGSDVVLEPTTGRGAGAWLAGTESWRCVRGEVTLSTDPEAQIWLYLRSTPEENFLRLGWTGEKIQLQAGVGGSDAQALATGHAPAGAERVRIHFDLFDRRVRFEVPGGNFPERSFLLPSELENGMVGVAAWCLGGEPAPVVLGDLRLEPRLAAGVVLRDIEELRRREAGSIDVVAPAGFELSPSGDRIEGKIDPALTLLASYRGASLWPVVRPGSPDLLAGAGSLAAEIRRVAGSDGVQGTILDWRAVETTRSDGLHPLETLFRSAGSPIGLLVEPEQLEELVREDLVGKLAWIGLPREAGRRGVVPPEKLLLFEESRR